MSKHPGRPKVYTVQATARISPDAVKQSAEFAALMPKMSVNEYYCECIEAINQMIADPKEPKIPRLVIALRAIRAADKKT